MLQPPQAYQSFENKQPQLSTPSPKNTNSFLDLSQIKLNGIEEEKKIECSSFNYGSLQESEREAQKTEIRNKWGADNLAPGMCKICWSTLAFSQSYPLQCDHCFHEECIRMHILVQMEDSRFPIRCPFKECSKILLISDIRLILGEEELQKYYRLSFKHYAASNASQLVGCPTAGCQNYVFKTQEDSCIEQFCCTSCLKQYCLKCMRQWHGGMSCEEAKQLTKESDEEFEDFSKDKGYKRCPNCQAMINLFHGCDWMQCRCGYTYCFTCLQVHKQHTHADWVYQTQLEEIREHYAAKRLEHLRAQRKIKKSERERQYEIAARNPHTLWIFKEREKWEAERQKQMFKSTPAPQFPQVPQTVQSGFEKEVGKKKKALSLLHKSIRNDWKSAIRARVFERNSLISIDIDEQMAIKKPRKKKKKGKKKKKSKPDHTKFWDVSAFQLWLGKIIIPEQEEQ